MFPVLDSTAATISGISNGNLHAFGNFDQCLSIDVIDLNISGKYCLVKMRYWPTPELYPNFYATNITIYQEPSPISPVWSLLRVSHFQLYISILNYWITFYFRADKINKF